MGLQLRPALAPADEMAASALDTAGGEYPWAELAQSLWSKSVISRNVNSVTIKSKIWEPLQAESFPMRWLFALESLQVLERYVIVLQLRTRLLTCSSFLWPTFSDESSNQHVLLIAMFVDVKQRSHFMNWGSCNFFLPQTGSMPC